MAWIVVGISGVTCSGKTTLASRLLQAFPDSVCVNQDKYFLPESSDRHVLIPELNHFNWELLSAMDMEAMTRNILTIMSQSTTGPRLLLIEGHTIFNYAPVATLCRRKFYLQLSMEECWARRQARSYEPPDVPGYFHQVVWPEAERHRLEVVEGQSDVKWLSGMQDQDVLEKQVATEIRDLITSLQQ